jgi:hypothetical protein
MNSQLLAVVSNLVRAWTRVYTWGMRTELRDARRIEIESDLWESQHHSVGDGSALQILLRLLLGIPADLSWRAEHVVAAAKPMHAKIALATAVGLLVIVVMSFFALSGRSELPQLPERPIPFYVEKKRVPPPPPPPGPTWAEFVAKVNKKESGNGERPSRSR